MSGPGPDDSFDEDAARHADGDENDRAGENAPTAPPRDVATDGASNPVTIEEDGPIRWFLRTDDPTVVAIRDVLSSVAIVAVIGLILFGVSGIWPPLVAVESGSMEPNMQKGDLIFVVEEDRFVGDGPVDGTGVVTYRAGTDNGYDKFGNPGDVIIYRPNGSEFRTPVIHRAHFWVEEDENWVETKANAEYLDGATCDDLDSCPAPHAGFVTMGDANGGYDQHPIYGSRTTVVKPEWVVGKAAFRVPWLGHVRLAFDELLTAPATPALGPAPFGDASDVVGAAAVAGVALADRRR